MSRENRARPMSQFTPTLSPRVEPRPARYCKNASCGARLARDQPLSEEYCSPCRYRYPGLPIAAPRRRPDPDRPPPPTCPVCNRGNCEWGGGKYRSRCSACRKASRTL